MADRSGKKPDPPPQHPILRVLVGSHACGTSTDESDRDERIVFQAPTRDFFKVGQPKVKETLWVEDVVIGQDTTGWEVGRFVQRAIHGDPNILQVLWAPVLEATGDGMDLLAIRGAFLCKGAIYDAFSGYSKNQAKKMMEEPMVGWTVRNWKFAEAYLRALMQGGTLLRTGKLVMDFSLSDPAAQRALIRAKRGEASVGEVVERARNLQEELFSAFNRSALPTLPDINTVNDWLLNLREYGWRMP